MERGHNFVVLEVLAESAAQHDLNAKTNVNPSREKNYYYYFVSYCLIGDAFAQYEVLVLLLDNVVAVTDGHGRRRKRLAWRVNIRQRRRAGPTRAAASTAAPAGRIVVTANRSGSCAG